MAGLAIVSGGMDSVTMLYAYQGAIDHVLFFDYGSKHNKNEKKFSAYHSNTLGKIWRCIDLPFINQLFKSDLLQSGGNIPEGHYQDSSMRSTVVPFRNGIMLSIAAGVAESLECSQLFIANHFGDNAVYPDCRESFVVPMREAIKNGTYLNINLISPYLNWTKKDIARQGKDLKVDFSLTWSCYKGGEIHCGKCGTCTERKEALAGFDSTIYA